MLIMASEVGVYDVPPENVILKSRLKPGRMLLVDTEEKSFIQDIELKSFIAKSRPHSEWLKEKVSRLSIFEHFQLMSSDGYFVSTEKFLSRNYHNLCAIILSG